MLKVDEVNIKILKDLLKEGRKSFSDIAKESGTSEEVIAKRFQQMKKSGIIVGSSIQLNYPLIGYHVTGTLQLSVSPELTDYAVEFIQNIPNVYMVFQTYRRENVKAIVKLRSLSELEQIKEVIRKKLSITELKTYLWLGVKNIPENLQINSDYEYKTLNNDCQIMENKQLKIDKADMQIIEKLSKNGRLPFKKIAEELGTSIDTVTRRYEKLKNYNVIKPVIQINPIEIGYCATTSFNIMLICQSSTKDTIKELCEIPDIIHIIKTSGEYDLQALAIIRSLESYLKIQDAISKLPNLKISDTEIVPMHRIWPLFKTHISTFN